MLFGLLSKTIFAHCRNELGNLGLRAHCAGNGAPENWKAVLLWESLTTRAQRFQFDWAPRVPF